MPAELAAIRKQAKFAGRLYLFMAVTAPFGLLYVPGALIVARDAGATADRLRASGWLLRLGMGSELIHQALAIFLAYALYRLFKPVDDKQAALLLILGALVSVPIMFINVLNELAALMLVGDAKFLAVFDRAQLDALAYLFLRLHSRGIDIASIFWGLWLFPFGTLVIRSGFIPRWLGYLLYAAGVGYVVNAFVGIVLPQFAVAVESVATILYIGELPIIFWLAFWGARARPAVVVAPA